MIGWYLLLIFVALLFVGLHAFVFPKFFFKINYNHVSKERGVIAVNDPQGKSILYDPAPDLRAYIRQYILIGKGLFGRKSYGLSFACPSALGKNKECAQIFEKELKGACGGFFLVYTRTEEGRRLILECRKSSYITKNHKFLDRQYKVRRTE